MVKIISADRARQLEAYPAVRYPRDRGAITGFAGESRGRFKASPDRRTIQISAVEPRRDADPPCRP